jgi:hypothetical protein
MSFRACPAAELFLRVLSWQGCDMRHPLVLACGYASPHFVHASQALLYAFLSTAHSGLLRMILLLTEIGMLTSGGRSS